MRLPVSRVPSVFVALLAAALASVCRRRPDPGEDRHSDRPRHPALHRGRGRRRRRRRVPRRQRRRQGAGDPEAPARAGDAEGRPQEAGVHAGEAGASSGRASWPTANSPTHRRADARRRARTRRSSRSSRASSTRPAKGVAERSKKTLTTDESDKLIEETVKAQQEVVAKVKDTFSRDKKTDHFGGLFNIIVWNNNGKITKRLDPVGLTFGEHFGIDAEDLHEAEVHPPQRAGAGQGRRLERGAVPAAWTTTSQKTIRVKMLENEFIKQNDQPLPEDDRLPRSSVQRHGAAGKVAGVGTGRRADRARNAAHVLGVRGVSIRQQYV